jgi:DnaJ-class molecular chaperone
LNLFKRILEVDPTCRDETIIRKAYLEKVKQYHPDSSFQDNKGDHQKFHQVQQAYEALIVNQKIFILKERNLFLC